MDDAVAPSHDAALMSIFDLVNRRFNSLDDRVDAIAKDMLCTHLRPVSRHHMCAPDAIVLHGGLLDPTLDTIVEYEKNGDKFTPTKAAFVSMSGDRLPSRSRMPYTMAVLAFGDAELAADDVLSSPFLPARAAEYSSLVRALFPDADWPAIHKYVTKSYVDLIKHSRTDRFLRPAACGIAGIPHEYDIVYGLLSLFLSKKFAPIDRVTWELNGGNMRAKINSDDFTCMRDALMPPVRAFIWLHGTPPVTTTMYQIPWRYDLEAAETVLFGNMYGRDAFSNVKLFEMAPPSSICYMRRRGA